MLAGLILAGGRSTRFGSDKAQALLEGRTLLDWAVDGFKSRCAVLAVSARPGAPSEARAQALGLTVIPDLPQDASGPLAGLRAGLEWARSVGAERLAVRPVDTPFLPGDLPERLAEAMGGAPAAYCLTPDGPEALCSLWAVSALDRVAEVLAGGRHPPVRQFLNAIGAAAWTAPDPDAFFNVNTLQALGQARERLIAARTPAR